MSMDIRKAVEAARRIVHEAHCEGKLQHLTSRIVRQEVEQLLGFEEGALEEKSIKKRMNEEISQTVEEVQSSKSGLAGNKAKSRRALQKKKTAVPTEDLRPARENENARTPESASLQNQRVCNAENVDFDAGTSRKALVKQMITDTPLGERKRRQRNRKSQAIIESDIDEETLAAASTARPKLDARTKTIHEEKLAVDVKDESVMVEDNIVFEASSSDESSEVENRKAGTKILERSISVERSKGRRGIFKSKEIISDDDDSDTNVVSNPSEASITSTKREDKRRIKVKEKRNSLLPKRSRGRINDQDNKASSSKLSSAKVHINKSIRDAAMDTNTNMSASVEKSQDEGSHINPDLSGMEDDEPQKKKRKSVPKGEKKSSSKKPSKEPLSPDEEQIKKLKSFIVACGVRKKWASELKDCLTPPSQIKHLRALLEDLGMKGRFSMEQARTIKAKRDLAKELEDVREFAEKHAKSETRERSASAKETQKGRRESTAATGDSEVSNGEVESEDGGDAYDNERDEDEDENVPKRKPMNALRSIQAFLDDQSDKNG